MAQYLQSIQAFLTLELSQYSKSGSTFSSSEPIAACTASATAPYSETPCICAPPSDPLIGAQALLECCPKSLAIDFAVENSIVFCKSLWK